MRTDLSGANLSKSNLRNVKFWGSNLKGANLWGAYLQDAELEEPINIENIQLQEAQLLNTRLKRKTIENKVSEERMQDYSAAKEIYLILKNNFDSIGRYDDESWAFLKEKEMERKELSCLGGARNGLRWIISNFLNITCGYGERPSNVIFTSISVIFIFSLLYYFSGIKTEFGLRVIHNSAGSIQYNLTNLLHCIYFSINSFAKLGDNIYRPASLASMIASNTESLIGIFLLSLFIVSLVKRWGKG